MKTILNTGLFKDEPINTTLTCTCGAEWRAHSKLTRRGDSFVHEISAQCPNCRDVTDITRSSTDAELFTLRGK